MTPAFELLVEEQHGVFTTAQAAPAGVSRRVVANRVRRGQWQRVHHGVYATRAGPLPPPALWCAALAYAGEPSWLSHTTAASIHGLLAPADTVVHLSIPHARRLDGDAGLAIHRTIHLDPSDFVVRRGMKLTSVERTILDCFRSFPRREAARALAADAVQRRLTVAPRLRAAAERLGMPGCDWIATLLADLEGGSESELELLFAAVCRAHDLPMPDRQYRVGRHRVDAAFRGGRVLVELDSRSFHFSAADWERDLKRQNDLMRQGRILLRFTWRMLREEPEGAAAQVRSALEEIDRADAIDRAGAAGRVMGA